MQKSSWYAVYIAYADIHMAHTYIQTYSIYTGQYTEDMMNTPYTYHSCKHKFGQDTLKCTKDVHIHIISHLLVVCHPLQGEM